MKINCPTCQKEVEWGEQSPDRPFCSERCKLIDLGEWASGGHTIPGGSEEDELMSEELKKINQDSLH